MCSKTKTWPSTATTYQTLQTWLDQADAIVVGIGAGMSAAAGLTYSGERFERLFPDFKDRFGIQDMYSGGFYPFPDRETYWAWWSRHIQANRYAPEAGQPYHDLLALLKGRDYFVVTTNVDHQLQKAGIDRDRLFYMQGDYGLIQCQAGCHQETYDNQDLVTAMVARQADLRVPSDLLPQCPVCGGPMVPNLRIDDRFVQDAGWYQGLDRYQAFMDRVADGKVVYLECGVGFNTPAIIKYPFMRATYQHPKSHYVCLNQDPQPLPDEIADRSLMLTSDISQTLATLRAQAAQ